MLIALDSPQQWIAVFPLVWFVGMSVSQMVFGRCFLNEIAVRLKKEKKKCVERKQKNSSYFYEKARYTRRAVRDSIEDSIEDSPLVIPPRI